MKEILEEADIRVWGGARVDVAGVLEDLIASV